MTVLTRRSSSLSEVSAPLPFLFKTSHLTKLPAKHAPLLFEQTENVQMWPPSPKPDGSAPWRPALNLPCPSRPGLQRGCPPLPGPVSPAGLSFVCVTHCGPEAAVIVFQQQ